MQSANYYREQARRTRRLRDIVSGRELIGLFNRIAKDYDEVAADLENGAVHVVFPDRMPQTAHLE